MGRHTWPLWACGTQQAGGAKRECQPLSCCFNRLTCNAEGRGGQLAVTALLLLISQSRAELQPGKEAGTV